MGPPTNVTMRTTSEQPLELEQPHEIVQEASEEGRERLDRTNLDIVLTALIGGGEVSLGGLAAMSITGPALAAFPALGLFGALALGGLAFPIGLSFVIVGRSELFTENFLIPVVSVYKGQRSLGSLLALWGLSWLSNVLGCAVTSLLLSAPHVLGDPILTGYYAYAEYKLAMPPLGLFCSAIVAGAAMTVLTWLLLAARHPVARLLLIYAAGYLLYAANLSHSIVGASMLFVGFAASGHTLWDVLGWIVLASAGNLVGGIGLVTLFRILQAREKQR